MKISFVGYKGNSVNIFPALAKNLSKKISGLELEQRFAPFLEDLPIIALECAENADFVLVFALTEEEEEADFIKQKLIDVELASKTRILKYVQTDGFSGKSIDSQTDLIQETVDNISSTILSILFNESDFEPEEKY
jgi:hypothetical protein